MNVEKIPDNDGKGFTLAVSHEDIENVDAMTYFREADVSKNMVIYREMLNKHDAEQTAALSDDFFRKKALGSWEERLPLLTGANVPQNFISLLDSKSKGEQEKLMKGQSLSVMGLGSLLCRACTDSGYTMSKYRAEILAKGTDAATLPKLIHVKEDEVIVVGETDLKEGQLRNVVRHRKVIIAHFLDRGAEWHCFVHTEKSASGEENSMGGEPHIHYLSDKWGISRADVLQRIKDGNYPTTKVHIELTEVRGKTEDKKEQ